MKIADHIVQDYLSGESIEGYMENWFFQGNRIFTEPVYSAQEREKTAEVYHTLLNAAKDFRPLNLEIWDMLFPGWAGMLEDACVDLIVGFPRPYDAVTIRDSEGRRHVILDLICWSDYLGKTDLKRVSRNLLTHELCHVLIDRTVPGIDASMNSGDYEEKLDAITFHEGFAHLLSYDGKELSGTDWTAPKLQEIRRAGTNALREALAAADRAERERYLEQANCGEYYSKFACMAGMLYLAEQWLRGGAQALRECFVRGYHGFAEKCAVIH